MYSITFLKCKSKDEILLSLASLFYSFAFHRPVLPWAAVGLLLEQPVEITRIRVAYLLGDLRD